MSKTTEADQATARPWHTDGDGRIYGPNPEFDPTDLQNHEEILIAETSPENAALIVKAVNEHAALVAVAEAASTLVRRIERDNLHTTQGVKLENAKQALAALAAVRK